MSKRTYEETANNWNLWQEYVDPDATMTEDEFNAMTTEKKVAIQVECFGPEVDDSDE